MNAKTLDELWSAKSSGDYRRVIDQLRGVEKPTESALVLRGQAYYYSRDYREAVLDFNKALEQNPANLVAKSWRGLAHAQKQNWEAAHGDLSQKPFFFHSEFVFEFLRLFWPMRFQDQSLRLPIPDSKSVVDPHDQAYQRVGTSEKARKSLAAKYRNLARKLYFENRTSPLFTVVCERAAELDGTHEMSAMLKTLALMTRGQYGEAELSIGGAVEVQLAKYKESRNQEDLPSQEDLANWGMILHELEDFEGSLAVFSEIVPGGPDDSFSHYFSALNWMMLKNWEKSHACFDEMIAKFYFDSWELNIVPFRQQVVAWMANKIKN